MLVIGTVFELASDSIWAVSVHLEFSAHFGFVVDRKVGLDHHLILVVGEAASLAEVAVA